MSSKDMALASPPPRLAQVWATALYERRRIWRGRHAIMRLVFIGLPVFIALTHALNLVLRSEVAFVDPLVVRGALRPASAELVEFAQVFRFFYLTFVVYFVAMELFGNLFRGEMADRTLHHVCLMPLRRQDLALGKVTAGVLTAAALTFVGWMAVLVVALSPHGFGAIVSTLSWGAGLWHAVQYALVLLLAALAYGSLFLWLGLVVRTPLHVAFVVWVWERLTTFLPQGFKRVTIVHWLESFLPVRVVPEGWFVNVGEPEGRPVALLVLLALTATFLALSARAARRLEVNYGSAD